MRAHLRRLRPVLATLVAVWAGCSNTKFKVADRPNDAGPGGSSSGAAGAAGRGGSGGSGGKPLDAGTDAKDGQAGAAGSGGSGGTPGCASSGCPTGQYCDASTALCTLCTKLVRIHFADPEELAPIDMTSVVQLRFPRVTAQPLELLFRVDSQQANETLFETPNFQTPDGAQTFGTAVNATGESASGPLSVAGSAGAKNFFFDQTTGGPTGPRQLFWATRSSGIDVGTSVQAMPDPFNTAGDNYSIAVAAQAARVWWMSTRTGTAEVFTAALQADSGTEAPVNLRVGSNGCTRKGADAAPWAAADGTLLLFSSLEQYDDQCTASAAYRDLYVVPLDANGQPKSAGISLNVNQAGVNDMDPSMSADLCWLYYASAGRLVRAQRN